MQIELTVNKSRNWLQDIADQIGEKLDNNVLNFPAKIAKGFWKQYNFSNGLSLSFFKLLAHKPIALSRERSEELMFLPIMFFINKNEVEQNIDDKLMKVGLRSSKGVFWPSSHINCKWDLPVNEWISNITITFNKQWVLDNCKPIGENYVHKLLSSNKPFYLFEEITLQMHYLISEITDIIEKKQHYCMSNLFLECKVTELLAVYFEKLIERPLFGTISHLNSTDVNKLFQVKDYILDNLSETPKLEYLAHMTGFSASKLHRLFKQVFGKSVCTYALHEKLFVARKMLESRQYNVSEVGYEMGYSNLSHFSEAFRKRFGMNPKSFLQNRPQNHG